MKSTPGIEKLEEGPEYEKVLTLNYGEIAPFVLSNLTRFSLAMAIIWVTAAISLYLSAWYWPGLKFPTGDPRVIKGLVTGLVFIPLLLIPVHEGLHLIPFRLAGARDIRMGTDLRQGIVYVTAHRFVAGTGLFTLVALTPFLALTAGIIIIMVFSPPWWKWVLSLALLIHTTMCAGDAALIGFMGGFKNRRVYTWDDADKKEAYFYVSQNRENDRQEQRNDVS
jgi:hypothetical protein